MNGKCGVRLIFVVSKMVPCACHSLCLCSQMEPLLCACECVCVLSRYIRTGGNEEGMVVPHVKVMVPFDSGQEEPDCSRKLHKLYFLRRIVIILAYRNITDNLPLLTS